MQYSTLHSQPNRDIRGSIYLVICMNDAEEELLTREVLERRKSRKMGSQSPSASKTYYRAPALLSNSSNPGINATLLVASLVVSISSLMKIDEFAWKCTFVWTFCFGVAYVYAPADRKPTLETALIPVITAGASLQFKHAFFNLVISLASAGHHGLFLGDLLMLLRGFRLVDATCPIVSCIVSAFLSQIAGNSLDYNEKFLLGARFTNFLWFATASPAYPVLIAGVAGLLAPYTWIRQVVRHLRDLRRHRVNDRLLNSLAKRIYLTFVVATVTIFLSLVRFCGPVPLSWYFESIYENRKTIGYWCACLMVAFSLTCFKSQVSLDSRRKLWHLCIVCMFLPEHNVEFVQFALAVAIVGFSFIELVRAIALPPYGRTIHEYLRPFIDLRDTKGPLVISHIYLLLGIAGPYFAGHGSRAGVICLGMGDTAASQIGMRFGRHKWFGDKSLEGTVAFFVACWIGLVITDTPLKTSAIVAAASALLEAVSPVNDNLILPMYMLGMSNAVQNLLS